jgi:hypothetical protein
MRQKQEKKKADAAAAAGKWKWTGRPGGSSSTLSPACQPQSVVCSGVVFNCNLIQIKLYFNQNVEPVSCYFISSPPVPVQLWILPERWIFIVK